MVMSSAARSWSITSAGHQAGPAPTQLADAMTARAAQS
jgi:hypothetical protein